MLFSGKQLTGRNINSLSGSEKARGLPLLRSQRDYLLPIRVFTGTIAATIVDGNDNGRLRR